MPIELEAALVALADSLEFEREDELAERVMAELAAPSPAVPLHRRSGTRRVLALVAAAAVVIGAVLVASPRARRAVADLLGIGGIEIRSGSSPAPPPTGAPPTAAPPRTVPTTFPATLAPAVLGLGSPVTVEAGAGRLGIPAPIPSALGAPDAAYFGEPPPGGQLSLVWAPSALLPASRIPEVGALLSVFRGTVEPGFFGKILDADTTYERVAVGGRDAVWLAGAPHRFFYRGPDGRVDELSLRLAGNTLIWTDGDLTYRLESALDREAAMAIAESVPTG